MRFQFHIPYNVLAPQLFVSWDIKLYYVRTYGTLGLSPTPANSRVLFLFSVEFISADICPLPSHPFAKQTTKSQTERERE